MIGALLLRPPATSLAAVEWVIVPDLMLMTATSWAVGSLPPLQFAAVSQSPPLGAIYRIVEGTMRGSSRSRGTPSSL